MIQKILFLENCNEPCCHWSEPTHAVPHQARPICVADAAPAGDSLFRRKIPCSNKKKSLFSEEQGIRCKSLNPHGDLSPNPVSYTHLTLPTILRV